MRRLVTSLALVTLVAWLAPATASAQYREFKGRVDRINQRELIVGNRMGDQLRFEPADDVVVEGEKDEWRRLSTNDWVVVSWKIMDIPRVAYKVLVLPEQEETGDGVE